MIEKIGNEMKGFIKDLKENIKEPKELNYILDRSEALFDNILKEINKYVDEEEKRFKELKAKQKKQDKRIDEIETKIEYLDENIDNIFKDIYEEDEGEFKINCPYCNYEFCADIDVRQEEIFCPECNNLIEIDWTEDMGD